MKIYRAVSSEEAIDLEKTGRFIAIAGAYEGKLFTDTFESASTFGRHFFPFDQKPIHIVEVTIDEDFSRSLYYEPNLDIALGVGTTIAVDRELLDEFNIKMTFSILDYASIG